MNAILRNFQIFFRSKPKALKKEEGKREREEFCFILWTRALHSLFEINF
jgi:hypothetical protein